MQEEPTKKKSMYRQVGDYLGYYPGGAITPDGRMQLYCHTLSDKQQQDIAAAFGDKVEFVEKTYYDIVNRGCQPPRHQLIVWRLEKSDD